MNGSGMEDWQAREEQIASLLAAVHGPLVVEVRLSGGADVYVQAIADEGDVLLEAVSNRYLPEEHRLSASAQSAMAALGWDPPTDDEPNYHQVRRDTEPSRVAALLVHTLAWGYGARSTDEWSVVPPELADSVGGTSAGSREESLVGAWLWTDDGLRPFRALVTTQSEFWVVDLALSGDTLPDADRFRAAFEAASATYPGAFASGPAGGRHVNQYRVLVGALGVRLRGSGALWLPAERLGSVLRDAANPARALLQAAGGRGAGHEWCTGQWAAESVEVVPDPTRTAALAAAVVPDDPVRKQDHASLAHRLDPSLPPPPPTAASDPGVLRLRADGDPAGLTAHSVRLLNVSELVAVAADDRTPNDLLLGLRDHRDHSVRAAHAARLGLSDADVEKHCNDGATAVLRAVVLNPSLSAVDRINALTRLGDDDAASAVTASDLSLEDLVAGDVGLIGPQTELALLRRPDLTEEALLESPHRHAVLARSHVPVEWATRVLAGAPTLRELQALCERTDLDPGAVGAALRDAVAAGTALQLGSALRSPYLPENLLWQALGEIFSRIEDLGHHDVGLRMLAGPALASIDKIRLLAASNPLLARLDASDLAAIRSELVEGIAVVDSFIDPQETQAMNSSQDRDSTWSLDLHLFTSPTPLVRNRLGAPARPGVYVVRCGECVPHIGTSSKLQSRLRSLAALGNHRGSAEVLCAAYCTGVAPSVQWLETESASEARALERELKAQGEPPQPRQQFAPCVNGVTLRDDLLSAAGRSTAEAGYIEALFDVGEQLHRIFAPRFDRVWAQVPRPPGPWSP